MALLAVRAWSPAASPQVKQESKRNTDEYYGPVVDYDAKGENSNPKDVEKYKLRREKAFRYVRRAPEPLAEFASTIFEITTDWYIGLPPLPITQSDVVILGEVADGQAYLSEDKTGVYSEFTVTIERVFKNNDLSSGDSLIAEREGGFIKFASGRTMPYVVTGQRLPRVGQKYVLFLKRNATGNDYHIITGYQVRNNRVLPLDQPEKFNVFRDFDREQFLAKVQESVTQ